MSDQNWIVVDLGDDTLRDALTNALTTHRRYDIDPGFNMYGCEGCDWGVGVHPGDGLDDFDAHQGDILRAVLRDVGTPATTERSAFVGSDARWHVRTRLVTDWTDDETDR